MVDVADRLRVCRLRSEALDLVEGELGTGGDDQKVVAAALEPSASSSDSRSACTRVAATGLKSMPRLAKVALEIDLDVRALAPADRDPWIRRNEMVVRFFGDDRELIAPAALVLHLVSHDDAAKSGAKHHYVCHSYSPLTFPRAPVPVAVRRVRQFAYSHIVIRKYKRGKGMSNQALPLGPFVPL